MPFNFEELKQKDQAELTRIKTALEIVQAEEKHKFERNKFRTENWRFFGIAILTALISLGSSYVIESFKQQNQNAEGVRDEFRDMKGDYRDADSKERKGELACDIAAFDNTIKDNAIARDIAEFAKLCNSYKAIIQGESQIVKVDTNAAATKKALEKLNSLDKKISQLTTQKNAAPEHEKEAIGQQIAKLNKRVEMVVDSTPSLKQAVAATSKIESEVKQIGAVSSKLDAASSTSGTKSATVWFKEGYFLQFGEYRVLLQYLDKKLGIQVEVCKTKSTTPCQSPILTKAWVKSGNALEFSDDNHHYRINLEAIDRAGRNPFTLAAYISFETVN